MTTNPSNAALIAAETFLYTERACPGGTATTAARIVHGAEKAVAIIIAKAVPATGSNEDRQAVLNRLDDEGSEWLRPVNMSPTDLTNMTPTQLLDHYHRIKHGKKPRK